MRVFLSWSGQRSGAIASALKNWLPDVLQQVEVWMSAHDIDAGSRWSQDLTTVLDDCHFGIICVTPENHDAPWLLFEAGCLAKASKVARVVPFLYGLTSSDLRYPLAQFQTVDATKSGAFRLVQSLNEAGRLGILGHRVEKFLDRSWPDLDATLCNIPPYAQTQPPRRSDSDILGEILALLRADSRSPPIKVTNALAEPSELRTLSIRTNRLIFGARAISVPYDAGASVSRFLDTIYFALNDIGEVPAYQYGSAWLLRDQISGRLFDDIGIEYCRTHGKAQDTRSLAEVGIDPGCRLEVIPVTPQADVS